MISRISWRLAACVGATALTLTPSSAAAQTTTAPFDALRSVVRSGDELRVTGPDGRRMRGELVSVTPSSVELLVRTCRFLIMCDSAPQSLSTNAVSTITRIDSVRERALIGLAAGLIPSTIVVCNNDYFTEGNGCGVAVFG